MNARMNVVTSHRRPTGALERSAVFVDDDQAAGGHALEVGSLRVYQMPSPRQHHREMIAHSLVHVEPHGAAEGGRKIDPCLDRLGSVRAVRRERLAHARDLLG